MWCPSVVSVLPRANAVLCAARPHGPERAPPCTITRLLGASLLPSYPNRVLDVGSQRDIPDC